MTIRLVIFLFAMLLFASCERDGQQDTPEPHAVNEYTEVEVSFDWSKSGISPSGTTTVFYPRSGGAAITSLSVPSRTVVRLKKGVYDLVVINQSFDEFDGIAFRGTDRFETLEAYAKADMNSGYEPLPDESVRLMPDTLALAVVEGFEVTEDMIQQTKAALATKSGSTITAKMKVVPERIISTGSVRIHLQRVNNLRSASGVLRGFAESIFLHDRSTSITGVSLVLYWKPPVYYEGSTTDGMLEADFSTFGLSGSKTYGDKPSYELYFVGYLKDNSKVEFSIPIETIDDGGGEGGELNLGIEVGKDPDNPDMPPLIEIPEITKPDPDPDPNPGDDGPFKPGVDEWEPGTEVEI